MTRALTPYEERNEYYATIQLGRDVKAQTELISRQTRELVATHLASANGIIASQERVSEGIDEISYRIEDVAEGIYGLKAAFEWGIDEVVWQIEQNREVLKNILEAITKPLDTQAKELRRRAEKAYANGWIDDALDDFLESEKKNRYDFVVHISLGHIYLFHEHSNAKALEYYEKAVKYARPESSYYTSYALIHIAFIKYLEKQVEETERYTKEAIQLSPDFTEALYRNAQYNAVLFNADKAIPSLERAIKIDVNYCEKANNEKEFDEIKADVKKLFEKLRREEKSKVDSRYKTFRERLNAFNDLKNQVKPEGITMAVNTQLENYMQRVETLIQRNSYRDYLEAGKILSKSEDLLVQEISSLRKKVQDKREECNDSIKEFETAHRQRKEDFQERFWLFLYFLPLAGLLLYLAIIGPGEKSGTAEVIFALIMAAVPVLNWIVWILLIKNDPVLWIMTIACIAGYWMIYAVLASRISSNIENYRTRIRRLERIEEISRDIEGYRKRS